MQNICQTGMLPSCFVCWVFTGLSSCRHSHLPTWLISVSSHSACWADITWHKAPTVNRIVRLSSMTQHPQANKNTLRHDFLWPWKLLPRSRGRKADLFQAKLKSSLSHRFSSWPSLPSLQQSILGNSWALEPDRPVQALWFTSPWLQPGTDTYKSKCFPLENGDKIPITCSVCKDQS